MDIEIREARSPDVEPLYALWKEMQESHDVYDEIFYMLDEDLKKNDVIKHLESEIRNGYSIMLLAVLGDEIIGFIQGKFSKRPPIYHFKKVIRVEMVGVSGIHRGKGVGTALFKALEEEALEDDMYLSLSVDVDNPAVKLYERLGFNGRQLGMYKISRLN